jgi:hypothetical protein
MDVGEKRDSKVERNVYRAGGRAATHLFSQGNLSVSCFGQQQSCLISITSLTDTIMALEATKGLLEEDISARVDFGHWKIDINLLTHSLRYQAQPYRCRNVHIPSHDNSNNTTSTQSKKKKNMGHIIVTKWRYL